MRNAIFTAMTAAMKAKEVEKLAALRYVWAKIKEAEIDIKRELNDGEVIAILQKEVKARREAIEQFRTAGRSELVAEEEGKLQHLVALLPTMMSETDIEAVVDEVLVGGVNDFGGVMRAVMERVRGKADGAMVSAVVKRKLS